MRKYTKYRMMITQKEKAAAEEGETNTKTS